MGLKTSRIEAAVPRSDRADVTGSSGPRARHRRAPHLRVLRRSDAPGGRQEPSLRRPGLCRDASEPGPAGSQPRRPEPGRVKVTESCWKRSRAGPRLEKKKKITARPLRASSNLAERPVPNPGKNTERKSAEICILKRDGAVSGTTRCLFHGGAGMAPSPSAAVGKIRPARFLRNNNATTAGSSRVICASCKTAHKSETIVAVAPVKAQCKLGHPILCSRRAALVLNQDVQAPLIRTSWLLGQLGSWDLYLRQSVPVWVGTELIFSPVAGVALKLGFGTRITLIIG